MPVTLLSRKLNRPDPIIVKEQLEALQYMYKAWGAEAFAKYMVWILNKKEDVKAAKTHARLIPFAFNAIQRDIEKRKGKKNVCLKPRQVGLTTWFLLRRGLIPAILEPGTNSFLISQSGEKATEHFSMLRRAYKHIGAVSPSNPELNHFTTALHANLLHTSYSNRKELIFDQLDNRIGIGSAEVEEAGQGSTLHRVICSEVARWPGVPEETLANLKEAIILDGTLDLESTANGAAGYFYEEYFRAERGESEFVAHFHPWWWEKEYRIDLTSKEQEEMTADMASDEAKLKAKFHLELEQIAFRREKKKSLRHNFDEKYPEDAVTCLSGASCVVLEDGSTKPIEWIVKHKYSGKVRSVNNKGQIVNACITNWYRSPRKDRKIYQLQFENAKNTHHGKVAIKLTEEHKILSEDGWLRTDRANGKLIATGTPAPGSRAFQILLGTILGDGHLSTRGLLSSSQTCEELIYSKAKVLSSLGGHAWTYKKKKKKKSNDGCTRKRVHAFATDPHPYFYWLRSMFYPQGFKTFPINMLEALDTFGIAVWFMDDGWSNFNKCNQSPNSRSDGGIHLGLIPRGIGEKVAEILTDRGYDCNCLEVNNNEHRVIKFTCDGIERLYKDIGKYVLPAMRYKLPSDAPKFESKWWKKETAEMFWDKAIVTEVAVPMQKGKYEKGPFYCIDVAETHNFVTLGGVVHNCFLVSGNSFFDKDILKAISLELMGIKPYRSFAGGAAVIFKKAIRGRMYVIGADPASGKKVGSGTDFSAAKVIDLDTGEEVAAYHEQLSPEDFALDLEQLGRHYNNAVIAVERGVGADAGGEGGTVLLTLVNQKYSNIYKHKEWWRRDKNTQATVIVQEGFPMTGRTRPVALNKLRFVIENNPELFNDPLLIKEAMLFVRDEKGRPAAAEGSHDDMVIASGIAQAVRMILLGYWDPLIARREKYGATPTDEAAPEELDQN